MNYAIGHTTIRHNIIAAIIQAEERAFYESVGPLKCVTTSKPQVKKIENSQNPKSHTDRLILR